MTCGHYLFHEKCLEKWDQDHGSSCPVCRQECSCAQDKTVKYKVAKKWRDRLWCDNGSLRMCCEDHFMFSSGLARYIARIWSSVEYDFVDTFSGTLTVQLPVGKSSYECKVSVVPYEDTWKLHCYQIREK